MQTLLCLPLLISRLLQQQLALEPIHLGLIDAFFRGLHRFQRLAQRAQPLLDLSCPLTGLGEQTKEQQPR